MRVTYPRVVGVRRADPNRFSVGDEAVCEFGPGLLDFLQLRDSQGHTLGEGFAPEWTIPVGAAVNAAYALMFPAGREDLNQFTGIAHSATRVRPYHEGETLLAGAWIEKLGRIIRIGYEVRGRDQEDTLVSGLFSFIPIHATGSHAYDARLYPETTATAPVPPEPLRVDPTPPRKPALADAVLPPEIARLLRVSYWHWLDRSTPRTLGRFLAGLRNALRDPAAPGLSARPTTFRGRLVDLIIPGAVSASLRASWSRRRSATVDPITEYLTGSITPPSLSCGDRGTIAIRVGNPTELDLDAHLEVTEPFGFGLEFAWRSPTSVRLRPQQTISLQGEVHALRPHEVNLGRPWTIQFTLRSGKREVATLALPVSVTDPNPGLLFYVLTEDCETFDGGGLTGDYGSASVLGNHNDYMDPEDYRVQMIEKPNALNAIADKHGAVWTHFWTVPQRYAAIWAAEQSNTGAWHAIVRDLDESVRQGSRRHEYAPHIHFDFEPDSKLPPQPRLRYDPGTDGFLPNDYYNPITNRDHQYHGWDGARKGIAYVRHEGDLATLDSKKGSLRKATRYLAELSVGGVPTVTTRTGAADFGDTPWDLDTSTRALLANGLLANSDAAVYFTPKPEPRGRQLYFCRNDDLESEIDDLTQARLVQVRAPQKQLEQGSLEELNAWFDQRVRESQGPGVRAVVAMTHAMFVKGAPDPFRDTSGGDFQKLDDHLAYVRTTHTGIRFASASEAVLEFLDYYTPTPHAVVSKPRSRSLDGKTHTYPIRILGRGIPISEVDPVRLEVLAPALFDPGQVSCLSVLHRGITVATRNAPFGCDRLPAIEFDATSFQDYDLEIVTFDAVGRPLSASEVVSRLFKSPTVGYEELAEAERPDILRLDRPILLRAPEAAAAAQPGAEWVWRFPASLFRVLVNSVGGGSHPIGRRFHPYAMISEGAILYCAQSASGDSWHPEHSEMRWTRPITGTSDFQVVVKLESASSNLREFSAVFGEAGVAVAEGRAQMHPS